MWVEISSVIISFDRHPPPYTTYAFKIYETACVMCGRLANRRRVIWIIKNWPMVDQCFAERPWEADVCYVCRRSYSYTFKQQHRNNTVIISVGVKKKISSNNVSAYSAEKEMFCRETNAFVVQPGSAAVLCKNTISQNAVGSPTLASAVRRKSVAKQTKHR